MLARLNQILAQYFIPFFPFLDRCVHYPLRIIIDYIFLQRGIAEVNQYKWENSEKDETVTTYKSWKQTKKLVADTSEKKIPIDYHGVED